MEQPPKPDVPTNPPTVGRDDANTVSKGAVLAMVAAFLGWMFDGFEMGLYPLAARPALREMLAATVPADELERHVGWWYSVYTALFLFAAAAGGVLFGWLGDRIGRTKAMIYSVLAFTIFTGLGGFATQPWHLAVFRIPASLGMGGEWALGVALVMEVWPAKYRPYLAGLIGAAANVGFLVIGFVGLFLNQIVGDPAKTWRWMMFVGVAPALLTFLIRMFVPESKKWQEAVASGPKPRVRDVFSNGLAGRTMLGIALSGIALLATWGAVQVIPNWAAQMFGKEHPSASIYSQICSAGGAIVGTMAAAIFAGGVSRRVSYFVLTVLSLASTAWLFRTPQEYGFMFFFGVFIVGMTTASFYGWTPLYLPELFPTRIRATGQGLAYNFGRIFAGVGTLLFMFGLQETFAKDYAVSLSTVSLIYLVGLVLVWFAPETHGKPLPE